MKHARSDYDRIQDPAGLIPEDEPVFIIRGQDAAAPSTVEFWAAAAAGRGAKQDIVTAAYRQANLMRDWQREHASKIPDMPTEPTP